ncbi:hypothetical protein D3C87_2063500 [compost metagenome]
MSGIREVLDKTRLKLHIGRVKFQEQMHILGRRVNLHAYEILDPLECRIIFKLLHLNIIAK